MSAFFPEVKPAHEAHQSAAVKASAIGAALGRAIAEIRRRGAIKGKKLTIARVTIVACSKGKK